MMAICPAGPPKLMNPSFSQYRAACASVTGGGASEYGTSVPSRVTSKHSPLSGFHPLRLEQALDAKRLEWGGCKIPDKHLNLVILPAEGKQWQAGGKLPIEYRSPAHILPAA